MQQIQIILDEYLKLFPNEKARLERLTDQLKAGEKLNDRRNWNGHITGSAIVLSPDHRQVLLVHHKLFNKWLQPGGHWESDDEPDPLAAAKREVEEETGLRITDCLPLIATNPLVPLDIDIHHIPARPQKDELAHWHDDFRYVLVAANGEVRHQISEVNAVQWFTLDAPETDHVRGIIDKLRTQHII